MLELAARSIGGLCSRAVRFGGGMSLEELVLANALGRPVSPPTAARVLRRAHASRERAGVLRAVEGRAEAAAVPGITGLTITIPLGQRVHPLPMGTGTWASSSPKADPQVENALTTAREQLRVVIR